MQIFTPQVAPGDFESISQMTIIGCYPSCTKPIQTFDIEVGWIVAPNQTWTYPDGTVHQDSYTHLFVLTRIFYPPTKTSTPPCLVQPSATTSGWSCGFNSNYPNGSPDFPGEVLSIANPTNASQVPTIPFVIVYSNGNWWIRYNGNWIGYIDGRWFNSNFNSVAEAQWSGEVGVYSNPPATQMGNGTCGTITNTNTTFSAHMYNMLFAESGYTVPALSKSLKSKQELTAKKYYNGSFYSESNGSSTLSYGGPTGCP